MFKKDDKQGCNIEELENELFDEATYATKVELSNEAKARVEGDDMLLNLSASYLDELENVRVELSTKQDSTDATLQTSNKQVNGAINELKTATNILSLNISQFEEFFLERIKKLEDENQDLKLKLEESNKLIIEKDLKINELHEQIAKLEFEKSKLEEEVEKWKDLIGEGIENDINLRFTYVPEFKVSEIITVKNFIDFSLKNLIVPRMEFKYPEAILDQDYRIVLDDLDDIDVMQGSDNIVIVSAIPGGKLTGGSRFNIKVTYNYDSIQQEQFIEQFLQSAIPVSLRNVSEKAAPDYKILNEIAATKPLNLLLNNKEFKHYPFKIYGEMNAASYWTDFHRSWQFIPDGYVGTTLSNIGGSTIINSIKNLYDNDSGYHNNIFKIIEKRLNESGVACTVTKKWARTNLAVRVLHTLGNLTFNSPNYESIRRYYIMVNFDININGVTKFYRGVTLALTDNLELYNPL